MKFNLNTNNIINGTNIVNTPRKYATYGDNIYQILKKLCFLYSTVIFSKLMLTITLNKFRCWDDLTIKIPIGKITLIKGTTGSGKTTILQAIAWCLYDKVRSVAPRHTPKAKTKVTLQVPYKNVYMNISRQKSPSRLLVTFGQSTYEDHVAQAFINEIFGNYDIWLASCYIGQGCRNSFLSSSNGGKLDFLNTIAFHEEDPSTYIEKLNNNISLVTSQYNEKLDNFNTKLKILDEMMKNLNTESIISHDKIGEHKELLSIMREKLSDLQCNKSDRDALSRMLITLNHQLTDYSTKCFNIPDPDPKLVSLCEQYKVDDINNPEIIGTTVDKIVNILQPLQQRDDLQRHITTYDSQLLPFINFTDNTIYTNEDYQNAVAVESTYQHNFQLANSLNISYHQNDINKSIKKCTDLLSSQDRLKLESQRDILITTITNLELLFSKKEEPLVIPDIIPQDIPVPDYTIYNTDSISEEINTLSQQRGSVEAHITHLRNGQDVLKCPHCDGAVKYQSNKLIQSDSAPSTSDEIQAANQNLADINNQITTLTNKKYKLSQEEKNTRSSYELKVADEAKRINNLKDTVNRLELEQQRRDITKQSLLEQITNHKLELEKLKSKIDEIPEALPGTVLLNDSQIKNIHSSIGKLQTIKIVKLPEVSSKHIHSCINYQKLLKEYNKAKTNYDNHLNTIPTIFQKETIKQLQMFVELLRARARQITSISAEKEQNSRLKQSVIDQIASLKSKMIEDPTNDINDLKNKIISMEKVLQDSEKLIEVNKFRDEIVIDRNNVVNLTDDLGDVKSLREHAVKIEHDILSGTVDSINASMESVCSTLFEKDISIVLDTSKELKTSKITKPGINFKISYHGGAFDNINQLSGGEGDRASLALTLALSRLSSCPVLMLDECLASLDIEMKTCAIKAIRENTNNTVLLIMHDGIEGIFDEVIDVESYKQD